jgi:hypothetical protein
VTQQPDPRPGEPSDERPDRSGSEPGGPGPSERDPFGWDPSNSAGAGQGYPAATGYPPPLLGYGPPPGYPPPPPGYVLPPGYPPASGPTPGHPSPPGYGPASGYGLAPSYYAPAPGYPPNYAAVYAPAGVAVHPAGAPFGVPTVPPPSDGQWRPSRVDPVAGTEFALVQLQVSPITSGQATGSLIAGIGSILVSLLVLCFGLTGSSGTQDWGGWVAGAFTVLGVLVGAGAVALGLVARRQIRRSGRPGRIRFTGRGAAVAGICCGAAGAGISLLSLALTLVLLLS